MDPKGLNIFVMNQGNFTLFMKNQSAFPIRSLLNASSPASLDLTNNQASTNVTYYFIIQNNSPSRQTSDILLHYTITSQTSLGGEMYYALITVIIGIALIALGMFPKSKPEVIPPPLPQQGQQQVSTFQQTTTQTQPERPVLYACKFCGATMNPSELFCPSCQRSQR
jgi:hypothetical protein